MFEFLILLAAILIVVLLVVALLKLRLYTVPEGQRLVIFRMGRFNRLAGPGPVLLMERFDNVARTLSVREGLMEVRLNSLAFHNNFLGYTFSFWCRTDPEAAAGSDRARLAEWVQFSESERQAQIRSKLREAVMSSIAKVDREAPPQPGLSPIEALIPVLPGQPLVDRLLTVLTDELALALKSIGVVLSRAHEVKIKEVHPNETLMKNFGRGITVAMLRDQMPNVSPDTLAQLVAASEAIEMPDVRRIIWERPEGSLPHLAAADLPKASGTRKADGAQRKPSGPQEQAPQTPPIKLEDWRILKRVPPARSA
jgi:hypothetical protein